MPFLIVQDTIYTDITLWATKSAELYNTLCFQIPVAFCQKAIRIFILVLFNLGISILSPFLLCFQDVSDWHTLAVISLLLRHEWRISESLWAHGTVVSLSSCIVAGTAGQQRAPWYSQAFKSGQDNHGWGGCSSRKCSWAQEAANMHGETSW